MAGQAARALLAIVRSADRAEAAVEAKIAALAAQAVLEARLVAVVVAAEAEPPRAALAAREDAVKSGCGAGSHTKVGDANGPANT